MDGILRRVAAIALLLAAAALAAIGIFLLVDRPGLEVEYFAIEPAWRGRPVDTDVSPPRLESRRAASYRLLSHEVFSIRWKGWIRIDREGRYRFSLDADEAAYLKLDGRELLAIAADGQHRGRGGRRLAPGLYPLEIGMSQTGGPARLAAGWSPPGETAGELPADRLFARLPSRPRLALREWLSALSPVLRRLLGAGLLLAGFTLLAAGARRGLAGSRRVSRLAAAARELPAGAGARAARAGLLLALVALVWWLVFRFTARTVDGDDVRYLDVAMFDHKLGWILNRYAHVYLLRPFVWLCGDAFLAGRHYWSFMFAGTVAALAVAAASLGPRWQLRTFGLTLFLLFGQVTLWATIGAAFADYSTMLFVTGGVAAYLVARGREAESAWEWPLLLLGALTVLAYRSKETGLVLLWLLPLLLWCAGRVDWRRFGRRLILWAAGAAAAWVGLMCLDAVLLGDFWFSLRRGSVEALQSINFADQARYGRSTGNWMDVIWQPGVAGRPRDLALRHLTLLVVAAALLVAALRRRAETCLLHLMPLVFLALLIAGHVRGTYVHSARHLLPVLPLACLLAASLFQRLGLEELEWKKIVSPAVVWTLGPAVAIAWLVVAPYRIGELAAAEFVPAQALARLGWTPEGFVDQVIGPLLVLLLVAALLLSLRAPRARLLVALVCLPFLFATAFELTRLSLVRGGAVQRGDLILYPWDAFGAEIAASQRSQLYLSGELARRYGMGGQRINRNRIASLYFRRDGMVVHEIADPVPRADLIVASRRELERWREERPDFAATVIPDASGELVLLRRRDAGAR